LANRTHAQWYSKSWYEYTGAKEHETQGAGWQNIFHPEDMPESSKRWSHSLRTGDLYETAYRARRHDGMWRWMLGRAQPVRDQNTGEIKKWFGTCTDIHDQVEALAASRQAQAQLESVINQAAMTLWAVDREGVVTLAEGPGVRQLKLMAPSTPIGSEKGDAARSEDFRERASEDGGQHHSGSNSNSNSSGSRPRHTMIGRSIYHVWDSSDIRTAIQRALHGESVTEEMEIDGRWFRTSYNPLRASDPDGPAMAIAGEIEEEAADDSEIIGVVGASMDITERKRAQIRMEESLVEKSRALAAEGAAREASRLKSEFLANMSHEIRTPIAGVIGLSELLLDERLSPQQRDYAETIQRSAEGLLTVINDVLDFSKVEIGKLDVERAPFNLEVVLRDQKRMLSFATQKKGLEFRDSVELRYKGLLIGDAGRLRQVITNILTNAIKFTSRGHISLDVLEVSEDANSLTVRFDVRDTGCGIAPETLSRLFQPFSQADPSTARRFGGTGLGLSISKNLVELMSGQIGLNSVEGQGSHAWFIVPFAKAKPDEIRAQVETTQEQAAIAPNGGMPGLDRNPLSRPRKDIWILIAEDNLVNAQIASKNLKKMGFSCRTAENGLLALDELHRNTYDAVLMDCQMPECDGYEATRLIRNSNNPETRMLPVIALTASAIKGDRERALEAGMVDYLAKPVKRAALEATLCRWLYDQDARQCLSRFCAPVTPGWGAPPPPVAGPSSNAPAASGGESLTPSLESHTTRSEYPFPAEVASAFPTAVAQASVDNAMSPHSLPMARKGSAGSAGGHSAKSHTSKASIGTASTRTLLVNTSDALGAAAALLAARRSSDEASPLRVPPRPSMMPRSKSHTHDSGSSSGSGSRSSRSRAHAAPLLRRSSREQGGMGRDLEGEVLKAAAGLSSEPRLGAAMEGEGDVSVESVASSAHTAAGPIEEEGPDDETRDVDGDSPMVTT
jgi:PAS domain S-box-containing protein